MDTFAFFAVLTAFMTGFGFGYTAGLPVGEKPIAIKGGIVGSKGQVIEDHELFDFLDKDFDA